MWFPLPSNLPIAWDELDSCQALMDFLFRRHQTSFILSSFQTFLLNLSIKVECVQGTVKDLNWNARRQTLSEEMVRDSQIRTSYWSVKQKSPSEDMDWCFPWTFLKEKQSLWLFIWMRIYIVKGHYKDYPQSQYFLGSWHHAWWLEDSLCHKRNAPFWNTLRFIPSFFFFLRKKEKQSQKTIN